MHRSQLALYLGSYDTGQFCAQGNKSLSWAYGILLVGILIHVKYDRKVCPAGNTEEHISQPDSKPRKMSQQANKLWTITNTRLRNWLSRFSRSSVCSCSETLMFSALEVLEVSVLLTFALQAMSCEQ